MHNCYGQIYPIKFPEKRLLSRYIFADSQSERLKAPDYYTHLKLVCQSLLQAASYIFVLSIIPLI